MAELQPRADGPARPVRPARSVKFAMDLFKSYDVDTSGSIDKFEFAELAAEIEANYKRRTALVGVAAGLSALAVGKYSEEFAWACSRLPRRRPVLAPLIGTPLASIGSKDIPRAVRREAGGGGAGSFLPHCAALERPRRGDRTHALPARFHASEHALRAQRLLGRGQQQRRAARRRDGLPLAGGAVERGRGAAAAEATPPTHPPPPRRASLSAGWAASPSPASPASAPTCTTFPTRGSCSSSSRRTSASTARGAWAEQPREGQRPRPSCLP